MGRSRRKGIETNQLWAVALVAVVSAVSIGLAAAALQPATPPTSSQTATINPDAFSTPPAEVEPALSLPDSPRVLMLGDSYMLGTGADDPTSTAWAPRSASELGWEATIDGIGGTGFTAGRPDDGTGRFIERIQARSGETYDLIFIEGGQNDHLASPDELTAAVEEAITTAQAQWPDAQIIVMGPTAPQPLGDMLRRIANPIERTAEALGALAMNPVADAWMTGENSPGFDLDGAHVNQAGHDHITQKVVEQVTAWSNAS